MDNQALEKIIHSLSQNTSLFNKTEEATKQGAILPILSALGWNCFDINEVTPEFSVGNGRVDYCLHIERRKAVFIEAKRVSEELERHEKQLLEYAFEYGIEIAVLTNGLTWWFYLPLVGGTWEQRKFFSIDIINQSIESVSNNFKNFLSKQAISDGEALRKAKEVKESREKNKLVTKALPKAWDQLLREPDEFLLEILGEKVESICGHRPQVEILIDFIHGMLNFTASFQSQQGEKPARFLDALGRNKESETSKSSSSNNTRTRRKGAIVTINGNRFEAFTVGELYYEALKYLYDNGYIAKIESSIPFATSLKRYLIAKEPVHQGGNPFRLPIEYQGYFMETHKNYETALKQLKDLVQECGLDMIYE